MDDRCRLTVGGTIGGVSSFAAVSAEFDSLLPHPVINRIASRDPAIASRFAEIRRLPVEDVLAFEAFSPGNRTGPQAVRSRFLVQFIGIHSSSNRHGAENRCFGVQQNPPVVLEMSFSKQDAFRDTTFICVPELSARNQKITLTNWLVAPGAALIEGERVAELLVGSVLFHVESENDGTLVRFLVGNGTELREGQPIAEMLQSQ